MDIDERRQLGEGFAAAGLTKRGGRAATSALQAEKRGKLGSGEKNRPSGAKARSFCLALSARLKSCPDTEPRPRFFSAASAPARWMRNGTVWSALAAVLLAAVMAFGVCTDAQQASNTADRLAAIDADVAEMQKKLNETPQPMTGDPRVVERAIGLVLLPGKRVEGGISHTPPGTFKRGAAFTVEVKAPGRMVLARLHYRLLHRRPIRPSRSEW